MALSEGRSSRGFGGSFERGLRQGFGKVSKGSEGGSFGDTCQIPKGLRRRVVRAGGFERSSGGSFEGWPSGLAFERGFRRELRRVAFRTGRKAERFSTVGSDLDGCDLTERGFSSPRLATAALGAAVAARRQTRRRRDRLKENARALAKLDEALMASLMVRVSSALEEHGAPATSNGGGGNGAYG